MSRTPANILARLRAGARCALAAAALATGAAATVAAPAQAAEFGMSDGRPVLFDSADLQAINFGHVRLVLPWNAAYVSGTWDTWLDRAQRQGWPILVAPSIDGASSCDGGSCTGPSIDAYRSALTALLTKYPGITAVEAWNEPNHGLQPTSRSAALAARYFDAAFEVCGARCTVVAGNMLDVPSMGTYLSAYRAALVHKPAVWGLHNYYDATYFDDAGVKQIMAVTDGPVWLTETGGLVTFRSPSGTLPYDEHRAADSLRWIFTLALRYPKIAQVYLYGMWEQKSNVFDSALIREDNSEREGLGVVRAYVGKRAVRLPGPEAPLIPALPPEVDWTDNGKVAVDANGNIYPVTAPAGAQPGSVSTAGNGQLRVSGKRLKVDDQRRVVLGLRCVGPVACVGRVQVKVGGWQYARSVQLAAGATKSMRVRLSRRAAARLRERPQTKAWAAACTTEVCTSGARIPLIRR